MARRAPEKLLHKAVAAYLNAVLPTSVWWTTFPAGGGGVIRGATLKAQGLKAGVPDILICHQARAYWIELKAPKGRTSEEQEKCFNLLHFTIGTPVGTARCIDDVAGYLRLWAIPTIESKRRAA
jgi:vacuolar-type H+-ATPase subunit I/STV1